MNEALDVLIVNGRLATLAGGVGPKRGAQMKDVGYVDNGVMGIKDGVIAFVGTTAEAQRFGLTAKHHVDALGNLVTPGLVDAHTHLVHAGSREHELALKLSGKSYLEILTDGGGILATVKATRAASEASLMAQALASLRRMLEQGTTSVEVKSGYGLDVITEMKQLRVAKTLNGKQSVEIVSTFLGPHAVPPEYGGRDDEFLDGMIGLLEDIKSQELAEFCDIFCERGVFSAAQSRRFLEAGKAQGLGLKIHADEIASTGGARLAAELSATSADHLAVSPLEDLDALCKAGVVAVLLPGTSWNLGSQHANARYLIDHADGAVAIATDYNPGSCPTESLQLMMAFAAQMYLMTPEEILTAVTRNAAYAIGRGDRVGSLENGKQADVCIWDTQNLAYIPYHFGMNHISCVFKRGTLVVQDGRVIEN